MATFSKRHYEAVAKLLEIDDSVSNEYAQGHLDAYREITAGFVKMFQADNPRFDAERFNKACGGGL